MNICHPSSNSALQRNFNHTYKKLSTKKETTSLRAKQWKSLNSCWLMSVLNLCLMHFFAFGLKEMKIVKIFLIFFCWTTCKLLLEFARMFLNWKKKQKFLSNVFNFYGPHDNSNRLLWPWEDFEFDMPDLYSLHLVLQKWKEKKKERKKENEMKK